MRIRFTPLLLSLLLPWSNAKRHDSTSTSCDNFCCQSVEAAQICESIGSFFRDGREQDNPPDADCKRCVGEYSVGRDSDSPYVAKFIKASGSAVCQSIGRCKRNRRPALGDERCAWGPNYWCSSMEAAAKCQTYPYCGQEWINQRLANISCDRQCLMCQKTLASIHFKGNALESIRSRCAGPQCSTLMQHLIELITLRNLSHGGVSPAILCNKLGMCQGTPVARKTDNSECQWAHSIWIRTRQLFSQGFTDYDEVLDLLLAECDEGSAADCQQAVCHFLPTFVSKYGDQLKCDEDSGDAACAYVLACLKETEGGTADDVASMCDKCEKLVTTMRAKAICQVKKVFNFVITQICRFFGPLETKCIVASSEAKEKFVSLIELILNTRRLCSPFCRRDGRAVQKGEFTLELLSTEVVKMICGSDVPCQRATEPVVRTAFQWFNDGDIAPASQPEDVSLCKACQMISADDLKILMWDAGNSSQAIQKLLPDLCYLQPKSNQDACLTLVLKYGRDMARSLLQLQPTGAYDEMCNMLGVCQMEERCALCAKIADQLGFLIENTTNVTDETVSWALGQICPTMNETDQCKDFVSNFEKTMTALIVKKHTRTNRLCQIMGICLWDAAMFPPVTCDICRFAVLAVETAIARNLSRERIIDWVRNECSLLPKAYQQKCDEIIQKNLAKILQLLAFMIKPELVCFELGLCSLKDDELCPIKQSNTTFADDYRLCTVCQMSVITTRAWIRSNEIVPKLLSLSEKACRALFTKDRAEDCVDAANSVSRLVNHWLTEGDPLQMCRWLRFCAPA